MPSAKANPVQIAEVVDALRQLGGEATLEQIKKRVTENRGGNPYDNFFVWWNEIQSVIENHSRGLIAPRFVKGPPVLYFVRYGTVQDGEGILDDQVVMSITDKGRWAD